MEDDQQFCLRWNNHQSTLIQNFDTLLESGTLVDCTLAAEGKYLKAHKVVLSACSPYFEGLLSEHYDKHPVFILKDVKFKELKAMMDYMYRGEVNISQDQLTALLKAAESLQIKGLSDSRTGGGAAGGSATSSSKTETRSAKAASSTAATSSSLDIPHASSGLTIEKNSKVPRQSLQQVSVSDLPEDSASPQLRGLSSREGSQSPTSRKRLRKRKRSVNNDDTNSMENHEASNSSDVNISAPALGVAPVATEEKSHADPAETIGRSALMQQLTKPADEMLQIPIEKPEPSEEMIQPKSEYLDDQDDVEDLTNLDDDMNDLNEMEQDNSRAGPSHDPSQHGGIASWHISGDRSNASVVGAAAGPPGQQDEVFLAAHEAAQAQRDSQGLISPDRKSPTPIVIEAENVRAVMALMDFHDEFFNDDIKNNQTQIVIPILPMKDDNSGTTTRSSIKTECSAAEFEQISVDQEEDNNFNEKSFDVANDSLQEANLNVSTNDNKENIDPNDRSPCIINISSYNMKKDSLKHLSNCYTPKLRYKYTDSEVHLIDSMPTSETTNAVRTICNTEENETDLDRKEENDDKENENVSHISKLDDENGLNISHSTVISYDETEKIIEGTPMVLTLCVSCRVLQKFYLIQKLQFERVDIPEKVLCRRVNLNKTL